MFWMSVLSYGTLHPLFGQQVEHYTGIDWAEAVIRESRAAFTGKNICTFEIAALEPYQPA